MKDMVMVCYNALSSIYVKALRKTMKNLSCDNLSPDFDLGAPELEAGMPIIPLPIFGNKLI